MQNKFLGYLIRQVIFWILAFSFYNFMRDFGQTTIGENGEIRPPLSFGQYVVFQIVLGTFAGALFATLEYLFDKYLYKKISLGRALLLGATSYLIVVTLIIHFGIRAYTRLVDVPLSWELYSNFFFSSEVIVVYVYCFMAGFLYDFIREVDRKFGPGNLWKMLSGEFYHPKEEQHIFMFLDLKSSTAIAEQLGHRKYSEFIQTCFQDVSEVVTKHKARIYQYVGDEIVLYWSVQEGLEQLNCIQFFFSYREKIEQKRAHYMANFGTVPEFKAGLEMGTVMVAEVGDIKREIAYHGDVLNTAARIQGVCNQYGKTILISENLEKAIEQATGASFQLLGDVPLKGKRKQVRIYSVEDAVTNLEVATN